MKVDLISFSFQIGIMAEFLFSGGMEYVTRERKWTGIANRLGLKSNNHKGIGSILRTHYERIIYPFVVFQTGKNKRVSVENGKIKMEEEDIKDRDYVPHHIPSRMAVKPPPPSKLYTLVRGESLTLTHSFCLMFIDKKLRRNRPFASGESSDKEGKCINQDKVH